MAAKKKRKGAAPRKPKKRAGRPAKRTRAKPKVQPAESAERTPKRRRPDGGALIDASPLNPPQNSFATPYPRTFEPSTFDVALFDTATHDGAQIAAWRHARMNAPLSTGGAVEPVPVPLESFPPATLQPDPARTAEPQLSPVSRIPDVAGLDHDDAVEVIKEWFLSNFEDPAQSTPRDDGEFVYIWGGPYDARDEISDAFSLSVPEEIIEAAIRAVEDEGILDWAPHRRREQPDYDELLPPDAGTSNTNALHAEMIERIAGLERAMAELHESRRHGIGHNNPPEPIETAPLSAKELGEIRKAMAVLKKQPPAPIAPSTETRAAVALLTKFGDRLRPVARATGAYLGKQLDNFITEAVKESGKRIVQSPFWLAIIHQLPALADVAHRWLESLPRL